MKEPKSFASQTEKLERIVTRFGTLTIGWDDKLKVFFVELPSYRTVVESPTIAMLIVKLYRTIYWQK